MTKIQDLRREYKMAALDLTDVDKEPMKQFQLWFEEALKADIIEPNAMFLATVSKEGKPSGRVVLLKDIAEGGLIFYTNYESRKAKDIAENQYVSLTFFWADLERQVRVEGYVRKVSEQRSTEYYLSRPYESQIGAWASPQSRVVADKTFLEQSFAKFLDEFSQKAIHRPPHWGGYVVIPTYFEFWQGRPNRMHDRICYELEENNWLIKRLAP